MDQENSNLRRFREENHLSQRALAEYLGVTCGFISLIEHGRSKLPDDKLKKLLNDGKNNKGWTVDWILPEHIKRFKAFTIEAMMHYVEENQTITTLDVITGLSDEEIERIENMEAPITRQIAEKIQRRIPDFNTEWLLTGEGDMFIKKEVDRDEIREELQSLHSEIEGLKQELKEIKEMLRILTQHK